MLYDYTYNFNDYSLFNYVIECLDEDEINNLISQGEYEKARENIILLKSSTPNTSAYDILSCLLEIHSDNIDEAKDFFNSYVSSNFVNIIFDALIEVSYALYKTENIFYIEDFYKIAMLALEEEIDFNDLTKIDDEIRIKIVKYISLFRLINFVDIQCFESELVIVETIIEKIMNDEISYEVRKWKI